MNRTVKIFNEIIQIILSPCFGEVLIDCKLYYRYSSTGCRYDLLFIFEKEYNNPRIQKESVLGTCDQLFDWFDLRHLPLSIVIVNSFGSNRHYSYFELMDEIYSNHGGNFTHPMYKEYRKWKLEKIAKESAEEVAKRHSFYKEQMKTLGYEGGQFYKEEKKKKRFLFW